MRKTSNTFKAEFSITCNRLDLIGEDDKFFNLHLLMAFNFILNLAGRISLSV
ncbi:hypothetical protein T05_5994 [Trichinella murrelli]|uniref:Uncharacterized protein n=1 Tax=Trichinella murrelli TaxID=144512 RepID=A0A0V0SW58_9BILA|nr:hypothetical protein T05_5994 [Trichinella murrelli]